MDGVRWGGSQQEELLFFKGTKPIFTVQDKWLLPNHSLGFQAQPRDP